MEIRPSLPESAGIDLVRTEWLKALGDGSTNSRAMLPDMSLVRFGAILGSPSTGGLQQVLDHGFLGRHVALAVVCEAGSQVELRGRVGGCRLRRDPEEVAEEAVVVGLGRRVEQYVEVVGSLTGHDSPEEEVLPLGGEGTRAVLEPEPAQDLEAVEDHRQVVDHQEDVDGGLGGQARDARRPHVLDADRFGYRCGEGRPCTVEGVTPRTVVGNDSYGSGLGEIIHHVILPDGTTVGARSPDPRGARPNGFDA